MFLYPVTLVSVRRSFEVSENFNFFHSLSLFKIICTERRINNCVMKSTGHFWGLRTDNVSEYVLGMYLVFA